MRTCVRAGVLRYALLEPIRVRNRWVRMRGPFSGKTNEMRYLVIAAVQNLDSNQICSPTSTHGCGYQPVCLLRTTASTAIPAARRLSTALLAARRWVDPASITSTTPSESFPRAVASG